MQQILEHIIASKEYLHTLFRGLNNKSLSCNHSPYLLIIIYFIDILLIDMYSVIAFYKKKLNHKAPLNMYTYCVPRLLSIKFFGYKDIYNIDA